MVAAFYAHFRHIIIILCNYLFLLNYVFYVSDYVMMIYKKPRPPFSAIHETKAIIILSGISIQARCPVRKHRQLRRCFLGCS